MRRAVSGLFTTLLASALLAASALSVQAAPAAPLAASTQSAHGASGAPGVRLRAVVPPGPPPPILPLSEVRAGMVGQALTVFKGTKPEPFKVHVVAVMRNFLPKQDVILVRADDPRVEFSGIVAGMSGSPVYVDGKLMGAIAYAWSFAKEPLAGVTPIEAMLAERGRPRTARLAAMGVTPARGALAKLQA